MTKDLYEALGVGRKATKADIKKAYRRKAKRAHPDAGGDEDGFKTLALAYRTLSDDGRRERYDRTGDTSNPEDKAFRMAAELLVQVVGQCDVEGEDVVAEAKKWVAGKLADIRQTAERERKQAARFAKAAKRLTVKGDGPNKLSLVLEEGAAQCDQSARQADATAEMIELVDALLDGYRYAVDPKKKYPGPPVAWTTISFGTNFKDKPTKGKLYGKAEEV